jgi:hypothetical protein
MALAKSTPKADHTGTTGETEMPPRAKSKQAADGTEGAVTNKMEAMRRALSELGSEAKNSDIQQYIKSKFDLDMSTAMISSYKTHIRKRGRTGRKRGRPAGSGSAKATSVAGLNVDDVRAVKDLADRLGADKLRGLVDVLYR